MYLKHVASIVALPVTVTTLLPILLLSLFRYVLFWGFSYRAELFILAAGIVLMCLGVILLCSTVSLFIKKGGGTIAPWYPTKSFIVTGFYSHVRNPMLIGVFLILTGESIIVGSISLVIWTLLFITGNLFYVPLVEEQQLAKSSEANTQFIEITFQGGFHAYLPGN